MEFFSSHTGNEENRRLGEGNEIACALGNFGGGEFVVAMVQSFIARHG